MAPPWCHGNAQINISCSLISGESLWTPAMLFLASQRESSNLLGASAWNIVEPFDILRSTVSSMYQVYMTNKAIIQKVSWRRFHIAGRCVHVAFIRFSLTRLNSPLTGNSYLTLIHVHFPLFLKSAYPIDNRLILRINAQNLGSILETSIDWGCHQVCFTWSQSNVVGEGVCVCPQNCATENVKELWTIIETAWLNLIRGIIQKRRRIDFTLTCFTWSASIWS